MKRFTNRIRKASTEWYQERYIVGYEEEYHVTLFMCNDTWHIRLGYGKEEWLDGTYEVTTSDGDEAFAIAQTLLVLHQEGFNLKAR